jgi:Sulfatase
VPRRRRAIAGLVAAGALALAGASASPAAAVNGARTPVVFISLDEFSLASLLDAPGHIDAQRFPNFARLASASDWFANTTPSGDGTRWATPALLAGTLPNRDRLPAWFDYPHSVFSLLARTHRFSVVEPVTRLCSPALCQDHTLPGRTRREQARALNALIPEQKRSAAEHSAMNRFIKRIKPWRSGKPPFYFLHVLMPHHPYVWLPSARRYRMPKPEIPGLHGDNMWGNDRALVDRAWQRYLLQVGYTDRLLGRLIRRMRKTGLWDRALLVILPDHGVSFIPGNSRRMATETTVGGIGMIPFFLKRPRQRGGRRVDAHVQTIDVLPTVADALDLPAPHGIDGRSALDPRFVPSDAAELWSTTSVVTFGRHLYPMTLVTQRFEELIALQRKRFGHGRFAGSFFALNPFRRLVGLRPSALPPGSRVASARVDARARGAPAVVTGRVRGVGRGRALALVIRGRVAATTRTYAFRGIRFEAAVQRGGPVTVYALP